MNIFVWQLFKIAAQKKVFFFTFFGLIRFLVFFNGLFPPLPEMGCPIFLEIRNPWGKVIQRSGLRYEHFCFKIVYNRREKKSFFLHFFTFKVPFNGLFAPTSRSWMSNIFRDSESLGKSNGNKWSQIWAFLFENCLKSPRIFFLFFSFTFFTFEVPFNCLFAPTSWSRMSNIFRDSESLRKSNGQKWSNIWTFLLGSGLKSPRKKMFFFCWFCLGPPS